jgi:tRNA A37 threonylcarbamoyladenosine dehydratase
VDEYADRFGGIARLFGTAALGRLRAAQVMVVGVGGVGSWAVEALVRSGVGTVTMVDMDDVCLTNTNRQLPALSDTVGRPKVEVLAERMRAINPACDVRAVVEFFERENADALLASSPGFVIDAIDALPAKIALVEACVQRETPVVVSGGAGGRRDATAVRTGDLSSTGGDGLLRRLRRALRHDVGMPADGPWGVPAVYSVERQVFPTADGEVCHTPDGSSLRMDCASGFGAASFVTGAFGFAAAGVAVARIAEG